MERATIRELSEAVIGELERLGYASGTIKSYQRLYQKLLRYADERQIHHHSLEVCHRWLRDSLGIEPALVVRRNEHTYKRNSYLPIRVCQCLTEWQLHGCLALKKQGKLAALELPRQFKEACDSYATFCCEAGYSERGTYTRLNRIKRMLLFFDQHGVSSMQSITAVRISEFFRSQIELDSRTVATMLTASRVFFRHLYRKGFTQKDLSEKLPVVKANRKFRLPRIWKQEDVLSVLNSIDRGNPVGKRDYAIMMLVTRYGLRSADVKTLKLSDLRWSENMIELVQSKTRNPLRLPLLRDVGWAIIDYLQNGRPHSEYPEVFLTCTVPIRPFGLNSCALNAILAKRVQQAAVRISSEVPKGMHSLRHTLASVMLANDVELPVISSVLGHVTSEATGVYLHTDIARLRECALDPEEV
ncbi:MAG: tyrosine-type recombinase/integrase [Deltaproteobacteria bacterium]|nr:tyrosine-type recombinase/integrase [Deltaproteobacteria bacterium]